MKKSKWRLFIAIMLILIATVIVGCSNSSKEQQDGNQDEMSSADVQSDEKIEETEPSLF